MKNDLAIFEGHEIRRHYDEKTETWWFSVVDIIRVLTQQPDYQTARKYWKILKGRLAKEGSQLVSNCYQLKLAAEDGKQRLTDAASRGVRRGEAQSRLLLTGLPRGSFGLELARADSDEFFEEGQLADTLAHVTKLVGAAGRSDEDFAAELDETAPRVIQNLRKFLEVVAKGKAGLRLESGDFRCSMNPVEANEAFNRVAGTITNEEEINLPGVLKGVLLESRRFDFVTDENHSVGGKIDENLPEEQVIGIDRQFFNERCLASLLKTTVLFKNGRVRTTYTLKGLEALNEAKE